MKSLIIGGDNIGGIPSEVVAMFAEKAFDLLDAPIKRVCAPDIPIAFDLVLDEFWMPDGEKLIKVLNKIAWSN